MIRTVRSVLCITCFFVLIAVRAGEATPVTYDEAISGDLNQNIPATLFVLDAGINTVKGVTHFDISTGVDFDNFAFTVPAGMHLVDIQYSFVAIIEPVTTAGSTNYVFDNGNTVPVAPFLGQFLANMFAPGTSHPFNPVLPLGPGTFLMQQSSAGRSGEGWIDNYTWELTVADDNVVPEPASLLLLATGLAGGTVRRWRKRGR